MEYNPEILSWNVRGLNNPTKRKAVKDFVATVKVNLVCFQETKLDVIDHFMLIECLGRSFDGFVYLPAVETRGGILLAWDTTILSVDNVQYDTNFLTALVRAKDGSTWWITAVYAP